VQAPHWPWSPALLGPGQAEVLAQPVEQGDPRVEHEAMALAV
jgi:hypothetical protein